MREFIGWILVVALVFTLIYIIALNIYKVRMRKPLKVWKNDGDLDEQALAKVEHYIEKFGGGKLNWELKDRQHLCEIEYNKTHLPSKELPPLSPNWGEVEEFIEKTRFDFTSVGESYSYIGYENHLIEHRSIPKSDFEGDTLKLIETLRADVNWFYCNQTGERLWEQSEILERFLRKKYPRLSDKSISRICSTYCTNNR